MKIIMKMSNEMVTAMKMKWRNVKYRKKRNNRENGNEMKYNVKNEANNENDEKYQKKENESVMKMKAAASEK